MLKKNWLLCLLLIIPHVIYTASDYCSTCNSCLLSCSQCLNSCLCNKKNSCSSFGFHTTITLYTCLITGLEYCCGIRFGQDDVSDTYCDPKLCIWACLCAKPCHTSMNKAEPITHQPRRKLFRTSLVALNADIQVPENNTPFSLDSGLSISTLILQETKKLIITNETNV